MRKALAAAEGGAGAAGSQGVLVTFQKILDPTSVVRESEYARSASGQTILAQMEGAVDRLLISGGAGVPVSELRKFVSLAEQWSKNANLSAATTRRQIIAIAEEYNINPANITRDYEEEQPEGGGESPEEKQRRIDALLKKRGG